MTSAELQIFISTGFWTAHPEDLAITSKSTFLKWNPSPFSQTSAFHYALVPLYLALELWHFLWSLVFFISMLNCLLSSIYSCYFTSVTLVYFSTLLLLVQVSSYLWLLNYLNCISTPSFTLQTLLYTSILHSAPEFTFLKHSSSNVASITITTNNKIDIH